MALGGCRSHGGKLLLQLGAMFASRRGRRHLRAIPLCRSPRPQRAVLVVVGGGGKDVTYAKRIDNPLQNSIRYPFVKLIIPYRIAFVIHL